MVKVFFQWVVRLVLSILFALPLTGFLVGSADKYVITGSFIVVTFIVTLGIHLISKIRIFNRISPFVKYIIILIALAVILFFSFVFYIMFFTGSMVNGNCSLCEKSQDRDYCYYECAYFKDGGIEICEKINSVDRKNKCYAWVSIKNDKFFCDKIVGGDEYQSSSDKTVCYTHFAVENKDISLCEKIPVRNTFHLPRYYCYQQVAVALQDPSLCAKIPDTYPIPGEEKNTALINNLKIVKSDCLLLKK